MPWSADEASQRLAGAADFAATWGIAGEILSLAEETWQVAADSCGTREAGAGLRSADEEKRAVRSYALKHPGIRHRELAWRMVDEEVAYLSPSTAYRILKGEKLVCPWRRRRKRTREDQEKARRVDEIWATDLMYVVIGGRRITW